MWTLYGHGKNSERRRVFRHALKTGREGAEMTRLYKRQKLEMPYHQIWSNWANSERKAEKQTTV